MERIGNGQDRQAGRQEGWKAGIIDIPSPRRRFSAAAVNICSGFVRFPLPPSSDAHFALKARPETFWCQLGMIQGPSKGCLCMSADVSLGKEDSTENVVSTETLKANFRRTLYFGGRR